VNVYVGVRTSGRATGLDTPVRTGDQLILCPRWRVEASDSAPASLLDLVGSTPLVELPAPLPKPSSASYASSRVRTRAARSRIASRRRCSTRPRRRRARAGPRLLEPTSGNTGIASRSRALRGYPLTCVAAGERDRGAPRLLELYGAEIVESPGEEGSNGAVRLALELAERDPSLLHAVPVRERGEPARALRGTGAEIAARSTASTCSSPGSAPAGR
jgi:cysteine synthase B